MTGPFPLRRLPPTDAGRRPATPRCCGVEVPGAGSGSGAIGPATPSGIAFEAVPGRRSTSRRREAADRRWHRRCPAPRSSASLGPCTPRRTPPTRDRWPPPSRIAGGVPPSPPAWSMASQPSERRRGAPSRAAATSPSTFDRSCRRLDRRRARHPREARATGLRRFPREPHRGARRSHRRAARTSDGPPPRRDRRLPRSSPLEDAVQAPHARTRARRADEANSGNRDCGSSGRSPRPNRTNMGSSHGPEFWARILGRNPGSDPGIGLGIRAWDSGLGFGFGIRVWFLRGGPMRRGDGAAQRSAGGGDIMAKLPASSVDSISGKLRTARSYRS